MSVSLQDTKLAITFLDLRRNQAIRSHVSSIVQWYALSSSAGGADNESWSGADGSADGPPDDPGRWQRHIPLEQVGHLTTRAGGSATFPSSRWAT